MGGRTLTMAVWREGRGGCKNRRRGYIGLDPGGTVDFGLRIPIMRALGLSVALPFSDTTPKEMRRWRV
jgi:hypothetical protein